jgi:hypothetical protein
MALVLKDRVRESSVTSGTGTITLDGAVSGFQSFSVIGNSNTTYYCIADVTTGDWEVGVGTYTASGTTLSRDSVLESSNAGNLVDFSGNIKDVFCTYPAEQAVTLTDVQTLTNKTLGTGTAITAGTINNTSIGATTASTGAFTNLTTSGTVTHNGGTANGVAYLNGSKVLTSGSALTFDGAKLGVGVASAQAGIDISNSGSWTSGNIYNYPAGNAFVKAQGAASQNNWIGIAGDYGVTTGSANLLLQANFNNTNQQAGHYIGSEAQSATSSHLTFGSLTGGATTGTNATKNEQMRIDSAGNVGIGTSSPATKLNVIGDLQLSRSATASDAAINFGSNSNNYIYGGNSSNIMAVATNGSERMRIDSAGNVGIGTSSPGTTLDVSGTASMTSYKEGVFAITDGTTVNLDPNNGSIQTWTLGDNRTPGQANWAAGQSITLMIDDGTARTITWTTLGVVWETNGGSAPTLATSGFTVITLWKVGTTIYGARVGDA